jgi:antitoxin (DNA-binding transcriptional repressor) of toxin-antitoxin stability system
MAIIDSYNDFMKISVANAKNKLPELIKAVEAGESITVCRRGVPVVDIIRTRASTGHKRKFGFLKERLVIHDPEWWKPMSKTDVEAFVKGRY